MDAQYLHDLGTAVGIGVSVAISEWKKSREGDESDRRASSQQPGGNASRGRGGKYWRGNSWRGNSSRGNSWRGNFWRGRGGSFWRGRGWQSFRGQQRWYSPQERKEYNKKKEIEEKISNDIECTIAQEDMVIFCRKNNDNCKTVTDIVENLKMKHISFQIDEWENSDVVESVLRKLTNTSNFPKIYVKNKYIGELNGLKKYIENQNVNLNDNAHME